MIPASLVTFIRGAGNFILKNSFIEYSSATGNYCLISSGLLFTTATPPVTVKTKVMYIAKIAKGAIILCLELSSTRSKT